MLNKPFDNELNDVLNSSILDLSYRLDWRVYKNWGIWSSYGINFLGNTKEGISLDYNIFSDIDLQDYYIKDIQKNDNTKSIQKIGFKGMIGLFYKQENEKWIITPYLGIGIESLGVPRLSYTLKKKDANAAYNVRYDWYNTRDEFRPLGVLYAHIKTERKISRKISLSLGLSYSYYLAHPNFRAGVYDYYDQSVIKEIREDGKSVNSIGVTLGVGFW